MIAEKSFANGRRLAVAAAIATMLALGVSVAAQQAVSGRIVSIEVRGTKRIELGVITSVLSSHVGEELSAAKVRQDVKNIYKLGFFDDVRAEAFTTPRGVVLVYNVKEKPVLVDIRIRGNKKKDEDDIEEVIKLKEGRIIDLAKLNESVEAIKELYAKDGFVGTRVSADVEPKGEGTVGVTFNIREGKKAYVKKLRIIGNRRLKTSTLKKPLYSKPKWFLSFITKRGLYNREEIERDSERLRAVYLDHGYIDAKVSKPEIRYDEKLGGYVVTFRVEEGDRYKVGSIGFSGDLLTSADELKKMLHLHEGDYFSSSRLSKDIATLTNFYGDRGYAFANVEPRFRKDPDSKTVDVTFSIEKGKEVYVRMIDIVGNTRTRDKVIRREIPIEEMERYNASKIQNIRARVFRLGYFEDNVQVETKPVPGRDDQLDVQVKVTEKPTGFFSVAGGFSSVETFIFAGQIQESNLFGYGKQLSFSAQVGGVTRLFLLDYRDPYFLDTDWNLNTTLFATQRQFRDFDRNSLGGSLTVGRRLWKWLGGRVAYRFERVQVSDVTGDALLLITSTDRTISSVGAGLVWDNRDNVIDPSKGNISRFFVENAGSVLGGNTDFTRYTFLTRQYFSLPLKNVLALTARYGLIDLRGVGDDLVVSERFFLGGPDSLRGFKFRRVGPRVPTDDGDFVIIGGTQELLFQADLIFPLATSVGLKGVVFFDMGNAFNDTEDLSINPSDLRKDFGLGIRWVSPFGPLRIEVGIPIGQRLPGERSYEVQFTVGNVY